MSDLVALSAAQAAAAVGAGELDPAASCSRPTARAPRPMS